METIFGLSTLFGKSGVAVIRISGEKAAKVLGELGIACPQPRMAQFAKLRHQNEIIDEALVLYFAAPASFTGEEVVELHTHGSRAVISKLFEIFSKLDYLRMAEAGEFSRRAFLNGKMDLMEAEGLADLIDAETTAQHKQAMRQMQGQLGKVYDEWRASLVKLLARVEAYIDFPDEDLPQELLDQIIEKITTLKTDISRHLNDGKVGEKIREGLYAVILGAPNVGKSSLLNFLAKRDAAIVSDIAGTTRDVVEVQLEIAGLPVTFADTAGIRDASDAIESEGIRRALARAENADIKIVMYSAGEELSSDIKNLIDENTILLCNKIDQNPHEDISVYSYIPISIKSGEGLNSLLEKLSETISQKYSVTESPIITRARHRQALEEALRSLDSYDANKPIELMGEDLRYAAVSLGRITGKIDVEELLDEIFFSFCIGK